MCAGCLASFPKHGKGLIPKVSPDSIKMSYLGRQEEFINSRVPWGSDCAPGVRQCPLSWGQWLGDLQQEGPLSSVQPSGKADWRDRLPWRLESRSHGILVWMESYAERQHVPFNFNPPSFRHFHLHCFSSCTRLVAENAICLCPLPWVCLPGFAICLRLSLPLHDLSPQWHSCSSGSKGLG